MRAEPDSDSQARPGGAAATERNSELSARELREFLHELANLVDGSMRSVGLARRDIERSGVAPQPIADAHRHLGAAGTALAHVAGLVRLVTGQLQGHTSLSTPRLLDRARPIREAIEHAVALAAELASDRSISISIDASTDLDLAGTLPVFPVIANALRNSIDAINNDGSIEITARLDGAPEAGRCVVIEVSDDGPGPPDGTDGARVFDFGFSTKPGSSGIGLALSRDIVTELGGDIMLAARSEVRSPQRGAILRVRIPIDQNARRSERT